MSIRVQRTHTSISAAPADDALCVVTTLLYWPNCKALWRTLSADACACFAAGAGKTTLMNALAGKASYGVVTGTITINGK
jgi:hypothetical protein